MADEITESGLPDLGHLACLNPNKSDRPARPGMLSIG